MRDLTVKWATDDPEANWIRNPHAPKPGYNPLEHWSASFDPGSAVPRERRVASKAVASAAGGRTVKVGDYFLTPGKLTVAHGTKITWKWQAANGDTHDVKLKKGPKGVKHFHSGFASTDYSYAKKLKKRGKYTVICTLHPQLMHETITVK
jgi:plastocyanin